MTATFSWDPTVAGQQVRLHDNPGRVGMTTGKTKPSGSHILVQVQYGPNEKRYHSHLTLEPIGGQKEPLDLLAEGICGGPEDLRNLLTFEKVRGRLTNVFYSMESSNTDFYPHQFKPTLKFLDNPVGRLLIADEVGLGKTIEALYIWKELQAREGARRLLVVCPAMLREKWQSDMLQRFHLKADIVNAGELLHEIRAYRAAGPSYPFLCIASLEGLRVKRDASTDGGRGMRADLAREFEKPVGTNDEHPFDLVIVDEAHYLRNPSTATNNLARALSDNARSMLFLTATPIQIQSHNLYQLLALVSPESFISARIFDDMLVANEPITRAIERLWRPKPDPAGALVHVKTALASPYFEKNELLRQVEAAIETFGPGSQMTKDALVRNCRKLESSSLISQHMVRTRKKDVIENRVQRSPQTLRVQFTADEKRVYNQVSQSIRSAASGKKGAPLFALVVRQRQMASSLVAALEAWRAGENTASLVREGLWEDLGVSSDLSDDGRVSGEAVSREDASTGPAEHIEETAILALEATDSKYLELVRFLRETLDKNPSEKFVLFAFFRGTLSYLARRLESDGIKACLVMGGMGDRKHELIRHFSSPGGPNLLLTSEVSSEGIDLQFCRFLINYDLPWNPMRIEQRIGRLDRIGQKSERISIINFSLVDTVEDRIMMRLYDRIEVFRKSIGPLEDILGEMTDTLIKQLLAPDLTEEERERRAEETTLAIINKSEQQEKLEHEAINLVAFADYIHDSIRISKDQGRWLSARELSDFVKDFLLPRHQGVTFQQRGDSGTVFNVSLPPSAQSDLRRFIADSPSPVRTRLADTSAPVICSFDPREPRREHSTELIDAVHPIVHYIRHVYETELKAFHPAVAIRVKQADIGGAPSPGIYIFVAHLWSFEGIREERRFETRVSRVDGRTQSPSIDSETFVASAARSGAPLLNPKNTLDLDQAANEAKRISDGLFKDFGDEESEFESENKFRCDVREKSVRDHHQRRIASSEQLMEQYRASGRTRMLPALEGKVKSEQRALEDKLVAIEKKRRCNSECQEIAAGIIEIVA